MALTSPFYTTVSIKTLLNSTQTLVFWVRIFMPEKVFRRILKIKLPRVDQKPLLSKRFRFNFQKVTLLKDSVSSTVYFQYIH